MTTKPTPGDRPKAKDFDCPDCHAPAGLPCRSSRGNALPTPHTRRIYKAQDAFLNLSLKKSRRMSKATRARGDLFVEGVGHRLPQGYEIHWNWTARRDGKKIDSGALTGGALPEFYKTWPDARGVSAIVDQVKKIVRDEWISSGEFGTLNLSPKVNVSLRKSSSDAPIRGR